MKLNKRQEIIMEYFKTHESAKSSEVYQYILSLNMNLVKNTILRDLALLCRCNYIVKTGPKVTTIYKVAKHNQILKNYDVEKYFKTHTERKKIKYKEFNFKVFNNLKELFTNFEENNLECYINNFKKKIKTTQKLLLQKQYERLVIESCRKFAKSEGNTYSAIETEILIKENVRANGHKKSEAVMILNYKKAFDYIFNNKECFKKITLKGIIELYSILNKDLERNRRIRKTPITLEGSVFNPLSEKAEIIKALNKTIDIVNNTDNPLEKALIIGIMISYIMPFECGNDILAKMMTNGILYANGISPISYKFMNNQYYKNAVIIFCETNSINYWKELFIRHLKSSISRYF